MSTFAVLLLMFAAFDDITTDSDSDFGLEYTMLLAGGLWLLLTAVRLVQNGRHVLGGVSLIVLSAALWAQIRIGSGTTPGSWPEYVVTAAAFVWFFGLSILSFASACRAEPESSDHARML